MNHEDFSELHHPSWWSMSEAERERRVEADCEHAAIEARRLYRSPLADLVLQRCAELSAELEAVAVKLPPLVDAVAALAEAERAVDEDNPLAHFCLRLDDCFEGYAEKLPAELDDVIAGLTLIADQIRNARKD